MINFSVKQRGRVAKLVAEQGVPYPAVRKLLRQKDIKVNGKRIKEDLMCEIGDFIEVYYSPSTEKKPVEVIYFDDNVVLVNKPRGITSEDFFERVKQDFSTALATHRLDRNTSGLMVYALTKFAEEELVKGFKQRNFEKYYLAEVKGEPKKSSDVMTAYLFKNADEGVVYIHDKRQDGDVEIKTAYTTLKSAGGTSVLQVELITGKTHQIRAHLAHIGHPIIGDSKYGDNELNKKYKASAQRLQSQKIIFHFDKNSPLGYLDGRQFCVEAEF